MSRVRVGVRVRVGLPYRSIDLGFSLLPVWGHTAQHIQTGLHGVLDRTRGRVSTMISTRLGLHSSGLG